MKAGETTLQKLLNTSRQFVVPIFQRNYSWDKKQCKQLWEDILRASKFSSGKTHFIGSIVYIDMGTPAGRPQQLLLIDGQQRIATLSLLLCALRDYVKDNEVATNIVKVSKLNNQFLFNLDEIAEDSYKLVLNTFDRATYVNLLERNSVNELNDNLSLKIVACYEFFYHSLSQINTLKLSLDDIFRGILNLSLVSISLDKNADNPQLIFESMNSTGKDLSQSDLLRNYLLMDLSLVEQNRLYKTYWKVMEKAFDQEDLTKFDYFIRDFLTIKLGKICKINDIYESFKKYYTDVEGSLTKEGILKELFIYAGYYTAIVLNRESDKDLKNLWMEFKAIDSHVAYPFLLELYRDYSEGKLNKLDFYKIVKMTINFIVRRLICELPTNSLNKIFAVFYDKIDKKDYLNSVCKIYVLYVDYKRFPTDYEVREKLRLKDVYHFRLKNYFLERLENYHHKEPIELKNNYSIEHILPQSDDLNSDWQKMLGKDWRQIQEIYLHTLGNLTLTGYNSEMKNKSFNDKLNGEKGFRYSHLQLNKYISSCDFWNEETIKERTNLLTDLVLKIWSYPEFCLCDKKI